jgi:hypothetical protein
MRGTSLSDALLPLACFVGIHCIRSSHGLNSFFKGKTVSFSLSFSGSLPLRDIPGNPGYSQFSPSFSKCEPLLSHPVQI